MNYGDLLYRAHENKCSVSNKQVRCYKTSFEPPKKLSKSKVSSDNIRKFLARKEEEEKRKLLEEQRKKSELLALRSQDKKAQKRVQVMLKRTKSANKSVMEDAIDNVNTADTLMGPNQCDDDDYGYVSQEASALYNKLMNKYENMPPEPELFSKKKKEVKDLAAAKDRVKLALQKEAEEAELPHKRKKKSSKGVNDLIQDTDSEEEPAGSTTTDTSQKSKLYSFSSNESISSKKEPTESVKPKIKKPLSTAPPPPDFNELLRIAKEKQHEPILIDTSARQKEPQRLMTSKEKAEFMREEERKRNRLMKERNGVNRLKEPENKVKEQSKVQKEISKKAEPTGLKRIPKLSQSKPKDEIMDKPIVDKQPLISKKVQSESKPKSVEERLKKSSDVWQKSSNITPKKCATNGVLKKSMDAMKSEKYSMNVASSSLEKKCNEEYVPKPKVSIKNVDKELSDIDKEIELLRKRKMLLALKAKEEQAAPVPKYVPSAIKPRPVNPKEPPREKNVPKLLKKKPIKKRCIESDSEYDSELDDFIDDGPEVEEDYSKVISEIFGYDKSKYRYVEEDDECMESNFAQQMKEEFVSSKIGLLEDLEDIRQEQEEKRRRLNLKKKFKPSQ
uniref:Protein SPT2 homolog n=1 Tax=Panstrongylus megistus TaxID=65343 RepID=A0A069DVV4_9HEMI